MGLISRMIQSNEIQDFIEIRLLTHFAQVLTNKKTLWKNKKKTKQKITPNEQKNKQTHTHKQTEKKKLKKK